MNDDRPVMIMGVIPQGKNLGMIWLLSSPEIKNISIAFFYETVRSIGLVS